MRTWYLVWLILHSNKFLSHLPSHPLSAVGLLYFLVELCFKFLLQTWFLTFNVNESPCRLFRATVLPLLMEISIMIQQKKLQTEILDRASLCSSWKLAATTRISQYRRNARSRRVALSATMWSSCTGVKNSSKRACLGNSSKSRIFAVPPCSMRLLRTSSSCS